MFDCIFCAQNFIYIDHFLKILLHIDVPKILFFIVFMRLLNFLCVKSFYIEDFHDCIFYTQNFVYIDKFLHFIAYFCAHNLVHIDNFHDFIGYFCDRILFISMIFLICVV